MNETAGAHRHGAWHGRIDGDPHCAVAGVSGTTCGRMPATAERVWRALRPAG